MHKRSKTESIRELMSKKDKYINHVKRQSIAQYDEVQHANRDAIKTRLGGATDLVHKPDIKTEWYNYLLIRLSDSQ